MKKILIGLLTLGTIYSFASVDSCERLNASSGKTEVISSSEMLDIRTSLVNGCDDKIAIIDEYPKQKIGDTEVYYLDTFYGDDKVCQYRSLTSSKAYSVVCTIKP